MEKKIKILMIIDALGHSGSEKRLSELLKLLTLKKNIECELTVMSKNIFFKELFDINLKIHYVIRRWRRDPLIFIKFYKLLKTIKPDLIHSWSSMSSIYSLPAAKLLGIKFLNGMITDAPPRKSLFNKSTMRAKLTFPFSNLILANSMAGLAAYSVKSGKGFVIHNGYNFKRIKKIRPAKEVKSKFNIRTRYVVGMVANYYKRKDHETYLRCAIRIVSERNDVTFLSVGDGEYLPSCKNLIPSYCKNKIIFTGRQYDVDSIINIFDVGILTTNLDCHGEGISNSIMEYMALGKPVIATNGGGTPELVINNETGYLIKKSSEDELYQKITFLLDNPVTAKKIGSSGRIRIKKFFNIENAVNSYVELYKNATNTFK